MGFHVLLLHLLEYHIEGGVCLVDAAHACRAELPEAVASRRSRAWAIPSADAVLGLGRLSVKEEEQQQTGGSKEEHHIGDGRGGETTPLSGHTLVSTTSAIDTDPLLSAPLTLRPDKRVLVLTAERLDLVPTILHSLPDRIARAQPRGLQSQPKQDL